MESRLVAVFIFVGLLGCGSSSNTTGETSASAASTGTPGTPAAAASTSGSVASSTTGGSLGSTGGTMSGISSGTTAGTTATTGVAGTTTGSASAAASSASTTTSGSVATGSTGSAGTTSSGGPSCGGGGACIPANPCDQGLLSCAGGTLACTDTGTALTDGTGCGTSQVCVGGACGTDCFIAGTAYANGAADPTNTCAACNSNASTASWTIAADGTACAPGSACVGGACTPTSTCTPGGSCTPANGCDVGSIACNGNMPSCQDTGTPVAPGTACGTGEICVQGACVAQCDISGTVETSGAFNPADSCQVCQPSDSTSAWSSVADGTACGSGSACASGVCVCTAGGSCTPTNVCDVGAVACAGTTASCQDTGTPVSPGTTCGSGLICAQGVCAAQCVIGGVTAASGAGNPRNACETCQPTVSTRAWTPVAAGTTCGSGLTCVADFCGPPVTLIYDGGVGTITGDSSTLYWQTVQPNALTNVVSLDVTTPGATPQFVVSGYTNTGGAYPTEAGIVGPLALSSTNLYYLLWVTASNDNFLTLNAVDRATKASSLVFNSVYYPVYLASEMVITTDQSFAYWTDGPNPNSYNNIYSDNTSVTSIGGGQPQAVTSIPAQSPALACTGTQLFFAQPPDSYGTPATIYEAAVGYEQRQAPFAALATPIANITSMALGNGNLYWSADAQDAGAIQYANVDGGGGAVAGLVADSSDIEHLQVDAHNAYWVADSKRIMFAPLGSGTEQELAAGCDGRADVTSLVATANALFWTCNPDGWVQSLPKP